MFNFFKNIFYKEEVKSREPEIDLSLQVAEIRARIAHFREKYDYPVQRIKLEDIKKPKQIDNDLAAQKRSADLNDIKNKLKGFKK